MLVVVDTNVVLSALLSPGRPLNVFKANALLGRLEFIAPEYLYVEIYNNLERILAISRYEKDEFNKLFSFIKSQIEIIPFDAFKDKQQESLPDKTLTPAQAYELLLDFSNP